MNSLYLYVSQLVDITTSLVREQLNALAEGQCVHGDGLGEIHVLDRNPSSATIADPSAVI